MKDVILHCFNWSYAEIREQAKEIAGCGYGAVLFPPPLYSDQYGSAWWQRYQPKDYRVIRSYLGNKSGLTGAIRALHDGGLRVYADVVFNHMANEKGQRPDSYNFPGASELERYSSEHDAFEADRLYGDLEVGLFSPPWDFNPEGDIVDWNNPHESQERWLKGLPDLELNDWVVGQQQTCLVALNALGFDGYRVDAVKHLPLEHITRVFQTEDMQGRYVFGEVLTANDREERTFIWPLLAQTAIAYYDFPLHETLRRVFQPSGTMRELVDPAAYGQALPWQRATTFTITHDIPNNDGFRWQMLQSQDEYLANAYIICRDGGIPMVYSDHNESAEKYGADRDRWHGAWNRGDIRSMIAFHNAVHGQTQWPLFESDAFLVFARGDTGIVAINKTDEWQHPYIWTYGLRHGDYKCMIHGHLMHLQGDHFGFAIPPRQSQAWLWQE